MSATLVYWMFGVIAFDTARSLLAHVASLYSPFMATIVAFYFASPRSCASDVATAATGLSMPYKLALTLSLLWNVAIFAILFIDPWFGSGSIEESTALTSQFGLVMSPLAGGGLTYFLATSQAPVAPSRDSSKLI